MRQGVGVEWCASFPGSPFAAKIRVKRCRSKALGDAPAVTGDPDRCVIERRWLLAGLGGRMDLPVPERPSWAVLGLPLGGSEAVGRDHRRPGRRWRWARLRSVSSICLMRSWASITVRAAHLRPRAVGVPRLFSSAAFAFAARESFGFQFGKDRRQSEGMSVGLILAGLRCSRLSDFLRRGISHPPPAPLAGDGNLFSRYDQRRFCAG